MENPKYHTGNEDLQPWLESLKDMQRAQAPERVFDRVMYTMRQPVAKVVPISRIGLVAACLVALVGVNIAVLVMETKQAQPSEAPLVNLYGTSANYGYSY